MLGKQAKVLALLDVADLLAFADCSRCNHFVDNVIQHRYVIGKLYYPGLLKLSQQNLAIKWKTGNSFE